MDNSEEKIVTKKKYITIEDIQRDDELHNAIVSKIRRWHQDSDAYMSKKRALFADWYAKLTSPDTTESERIKIHTALQHLKAFISTYYSDGMTVQINWAEFLDDDYAYMLEVCAKKDYDTMNKREKDFFHILNIWLYWVSVLMRTWYDYDNEVSTYDVVSPEYRLPDPNGNRLKGYEYHMFNFSIGDEEISFANENSKSGDIYVNINRYGKTLDDAKQVTDNKKQSRALSTATLYNEYQWTRVYLVWNGVKYMCDVFSDRSVIGRWERIKPVDAKEEKNPSLIPFPVIPVNAFPLLDDPCGIGVVELVLSFQNAKNRLMNLALKKEEWNAWFRTVLVDISKVEDIDLLAERPANWPIFIPFDGNMWELNGDVVRPVMDWIQADQSTLNMANVLDQEAQINTWYTQQQRWLPFWPEQWLGITKMQQVNSNLIFSLDSECISRWEVDFYKNIWLRWLKENLLANQKKFARIGNWLTASEWMVTWADIKDHKDPDIVVLSKKQAKEEDKQKFDVLAMREALIMANPEIPPISKLFYQRQLEELKGISREEIMLRYPRTADETRAMRYIAQINAYQSTNLTGKQKDDLKPKSLFYPWMDLFTYRVYLQKCNDGDLKTEILAKVEELMIKEWLDKKNAQAMWPDGWMSPEWAPDLSQLQNSMSSQLTSNVAQSSGAINNFPTRQDVLA
jgi:hypothetical protein